MLVSIANCDDDDDDDDIVDDLIVKVNKQKVTII